MKTISTSKKTIAILLAILMVAAVSTISVFAVDPPSILVGAGKAYIYQDNSTSALSMADGVLVEHTYTADADNGNVLVILDVQGLINVYGTGYDGYIEEAYTNPNTGVTDTTYVTYNSQNYPVTVNPSPYPDGGTISFTIPAAALTGTSPLKLDVHFVVGLYVDGEYAGDHELVSVMPTNADLYLGF
jgi:hypothetical protein